MSYNNLESSRGKKHSVGQEVDQHVEVVTTAVVYLKRDCPRQGPTLDHPEPTNQGNGGRAGNRQK